LSSEDRSETALLNEFGRYVSAVAQTFTTPLKAALEEAEQKMLVRIGEQRSAAEISDLASKKALAELNDSAKKELVSFRGEVQALQTLVVATRADLAASRQNFQNELQHLLTATKGDLESSRKRFEAEILTSLHTKMVQDLTEIRLELRSLHTKQLDEFMKADALSAGRLDSINQVEHRNGHLLWVLVVLCMLILCGLVYSLLRSHV
jgi:hypothetical protein